MVALLDLLHVRSQSARRLDRHAAARVRALRACRSHASRRGDRHRRRGKLPGADAQIFGDEIGWLPWQRPGFELGLKLERYGARATRISTAWCSAATACSPGATPPANCYATTLRIINRAAEWLAANEKTPAFGGERTPSVAPQAAAQGGWPPACRRSGRAFPRASARSAISSTRPEVLEFVNSQRLATLAPLGTTCPDHFLRTKIRPLIARPGADADDAALDELHRRLSRRLRRLLPALPASRTRRRCATPTPSSTSSPASA